jgi:hypothetical protein
MAQAAAYIPLSQLIRDPFVRSAFERAERGGLSPIAVQTPKPSILTGGAVCEPQPQKDSSVLRDLRRQARAEIDRLIQFLDASEPDADLEEGDPLEDDPSGIGDYDGLLEQCPVTWFHSERVE